VGKHAGIVLGLTGQEFRLPQELHMLFLHPNLLQVEWHSRENYSIDAHLFYQLRMSGAVTENVKLPRDFRRSYPKLLLNPLPVRNHVVY
jgi:hypothetical protein